MASFEGVLANIPGYGGYLAKDQLNRRNTMGDIQQISAVQGLLADMQKQQMQQAALARQEQVRGVLASPEPVEAKLPKLQMLGAEGISVAQALQKQLEDASQAAYRKKQGEKIDADIATANDQKAARGKLADLYAFKPVEGTEGAGQAVAYSEAEAMRMMQEAQKNGTPLRVKVLDPNEVRRAAMQAAPGDATKNILSALPSSNPLDRFKPLGGGAYATLGNDGQPIVERPPQRPAPMQALVPVPDPNKPGAFKYSTRENAVDQPAPAPRGAQGGGQLPTAALRLQTEELDAIGVASSINADLAEARKLITSGKLDLGPVNNALNTARNYTNNSNEQSRNLATLKGTIEKLRNDSLRLNKGVQTEGDAVRALNELVANLNDPEVVKQRFAEIEKINERAVNLRKMNIDSIRRNYGLDPLDTSAYERQPPAIGDGKKPSAAPPTRQDAPKAAIDFYKMNKNKPGIKEQFQAKYGYLPD